MIFFDLFNEYLKMEDFNLFYFSSEITDNQSHLLGFISINTTVATYFIPIIFFDRIKLLKQLMPFGKSIFKITSILTD